MGKGHKRYKDVHKQPKWQDAAADGARDMEGSICQLSRSSGDDGLLTTVCWTGPPDGLFDVIVPLLSSRAFVVIQLVCKAWCRAARCCLKRAVPKRPEVGLARLAQLYPNLSHLDLSNIEGLTMASLHALKALTGLRELALSNLLDVSSDAGETTSTAAGSNYCHAHRHHHRSAAKHAQTCAAPDQNSGSLAKAAAVRNSLHSNALWASAGFHSVMAKLCHLHIDVCPGLNPSVLTTLTGLSELTIDTVVTSESLTALSRLRKLTIRKLTIFEHLGAFKHLTSLSVSTDTGSMAEALASCRHLSALQSLSFHTSNVNVTQFQQFTEWSCFRSLTALELHVPVGAIKPGLSHLSQMVSLQVLNLDLFCTSENDLFVTISPPHSLTQLIISGDRNQTGGIVQIRPGAQLVSVQLRLYWASLNLAQEEAESAEDSALHCSTATGTSSVVGSSISHAGSSQLTHLTLDACFALFHADVAAAVRQYPLRSLALDNCLSVMDDELWALTGLTSLQEVSIAVCHLVTDAGLVCLKHLPQLHAVTVKGVRQMSASAAEAYMRVQHLSRRNEEVTGSFLTALAYLKDLQSLSLRHLHSATQEHLEAGCAVLTGLTRLDIKDCPGMTDAALMHATKMCNLKEVAVTYCEGVTMKSRNAIFQRFGLHLAMDFEGCTIPDVTRPRPLPSLSTQACIDGDQGSTSNAHPATSSHVSPYANPGSRAHSVPWHRRILPRRSTKGGSGRRQSSA